jgi:MinD superfamily P-loop ATPase
MKELVIISGKGGTGKTSITSSIAALAKNAVFADCDVDAADLHLILEPKVIESDIFMSGHEAEINKEECCSCGLCQQNCRFDAVFKTDDGKFEIDPALCEGCGVCYRFCPEKAISFEEAVCGKWFVSDTRFGKMVHAKLNIAADNSGKLVSLVREKVKKCANEENADLIIIDGPPGIGCPVIACVTGVDAVLVVTEPTVSGMHDLERVLKLVKHFGIKAFVCVNKWDLNEENTIKIENFANANNAKFVGKVSYNDDITKAQIEKKSVVEYTNDKASLEIKNIWKNLHSYL